MRTVQVLLSSYNGENYIREQLDSILNQEGVEIQLLIRDDGSTDGTRSILAEYEQQWNNISVIYGMNVGVISSFFLLLEQAGEYPYIAFADQDDVWLKQKLKRAVERIEQTVSRKRPRNSYDGIGKEYIEAIEYDSAKQSHHRTDVEKKYVKSVRNGYEKQGQNVAPIVYCSAKRLVDAKLNPLPSPIKYPNVRAEFGNALVENMCTGCTCVINQAMVQLLKGKQPTFTIMHDFWIYLVGTCFGTVIYDEESYILYRQHGANELGTATSVLENYKRRIKNFKKHRGQLTKQAEQLLILYGKCMPKEKKTVATLFLQSKKDWNVRMKFLQQGTIFRQRKSDDVIMKLLFFCGLL